MLFSVVGSVLINIAVLLPVFRVCNSKHGEASISQDVVVAEIRYLFQEFLK